MDIGSPRLAFATYLAAAKVTMTRRYATVSPRTLAIGLFGVWLPVLAACQLHHGAKVARPEAGGTGKDPAPMVAKPTLTPEQVREHTARALNHLAALHCDEAREAIKPMKDAANVPPEVAAIDGFLAKCDALASKANVLAADAGAFHAEWFRYQRDFRCSSSVNASDQSKANKKYKQDVEDTMKELTGSRRTLSATKARSRAGLAVAPLARFRPDVAGVIRAELDRQCQVPEERSLDAAIDHGAVVVFLSRILDSDGRMPEHAAVEQAFADLKKGRIWTHVPTWQGLLASVPEAASTALHTLLNRTRDSLVAAAQAHAKGNRSVDAALAIGGVTALEPTNPDAVVLVATVSDDARSKRDKAVQAVGSASAPADLLSALYKVDAIDSISSGPGASVKEEDRRAVFALLTSMAYDQHAAVHRQFERVPLLAADYLQTAREKIRKWGSAWAVDQAKKLKGSKEYVEAERLARMAVELQPDSSAAKTLATDLEKLAHEQRVRGVDDAVSAGNLALALALLNSGKGMTDDDRRKAREHHQQKLDGFRQGLPLVGVMQPSDPFSERLASSTAHSGTGWSLQQPQTGASNAPGADFPLVVKLRTNSQAWTPPQRVKSDAGTSRYKARTDTIHNDDKDQCQRDLESKRSSVATQQELVRQLDQQVEECKSKASSSSGIGAVLASAGCELGEIAAHSTLAGQEAELSSLESKCPAMPDTVDKDVFEDKSYAIETWAVRGNIDVEMIVNASKLRTADMFRTVLQSPFQQEDKVVEAAAQYNIVGDPMNLPERSQAENQMFGELQTRLKAEFEKVVSVELPRATETEASGLSGMARQDRFAYLLQLEDVLGKPWPNHANYLREVYGDSAADAIDMCSPDLIATRIRLLNRPMASGSLAVAAAAPSEPAPASDGTGTPAPVGSSAPQATPHESIRAHERVEKKDRH